MKKLLEKYVPIDFSQYDEDLEESVKWKYVIRKGKKVKKPYTDSPNKRIVYVDGKPKEKIKTSTYKTKMSKQNKRSAKKAKVHKSQANTKRKRSMKKRTW
jgi:hypothetical protein